MPPSIKSETEHEKWTIGSLKAYFEMRFDNMESALDARFIAQEKAVKVANDASEKRLDGMNEVREQLKDQAGTLATKTELNTLENIVTEKFDRINESIKSIQISDAVLAGKATQGQMIIAYIISIVGIVFGVINIVMK
jgi:hypothetical protein